MQGFAKAFLTMYQMPDMPSHRDIGKVYNKLWGYGNHKPDIVAVLIQVYNSFVSEKMQDYNSSFYCDNPQNILNAYLGGKIE